MYKEYSFESYRKGCKVEITIQAKNAGKARKELNKKFGKGLGDLENWYLCTK